MSRTIYIARLPTDYSLPKDSKVRALRIKRGKKVKLKAEVSGTKVESQDPKAVVESIRHFNMVDRTDPEADHMRKNLYHAIQRLSSDLYAVETHFVMELLQNADDNTYSPEAAASPYLSLTDQDGGLLVENNEEGFSEQNVRAICAVGMSTKRKVQGYIGEKGVGFKSVFKIADQVVIASKGYSFRMDATQLLGMITPQWVDKECLPFVRKQGLTQMHLTYNGKTAPGDLQNQLLSLHPLMLLFLKRIKRLHLCTGEQTLEFTLEHVSDCITAITSTRKGLDNISDSTKTERFFIHKQRLTVPSSLKAEKREDVASTEITLGFPLPNVSAQPQYVYAYLPIRQYGFKFLVQGDFIVPSSREDITRGEPWNIMLVNFVVDTFFEAFEVFKDQQGLQAVRFLEYVPLEGEVTDPLFEPIALAIRSRLKGCHCIRTQAGGWGRPQEVCLRPESFTYEVGGRQLPIISNRHLRQAIGKDYMDQKAMQSSPRLRQLLKLMSCPTFTFDDFVKCLQRNEDLHEMQPGPWYQAVYKCLAQCKSRLTPLQEEVLRSLPLLVIEGQERPQSHQQVQGPVYFKATNMIGLNLPGMPPLMFLDPATINTDVKEVLKEIFAVKDLVMMDVIKMILSLTAHMAAAGKHRDLLTHMKYLIDAVQLFSHPIPLPGILVRGSDERYHKPRDVFYPSTGRGWDITQMVDGPFVHHQYRTEDDGRQPLVDVMRSKLDLAEYRVSDLVRALAAGGGPSTGGSQKWCKMCLCFLADHKNQIGSTLATQLRNLPLLLLKGSSVPTSRNTACGNVYFWRQSVLCADLPGLEKMIFLDPEMVSPAMVPLLEEVFHISHPDPQRVAAEVLQLYRDGTAADMAAGGRHNDLLLHVKFIMQTITSQIITSSRKHNMSVWQPDLSALLLLGSDNRYHNPRDVFYPSTGRGWDIAQMVNGPFVHHQYRTEVDGRQPLVDVMRSKLDLAEYKVSDLVRALAAGGGPDFDDCQKWCKMWLCFLADHKNQIGSTLATQLCNLPLLLLKGSLIPCSRNTVEGDIYFWKPAVSGADLPGLKKMTFLDPEIVSPAMVPLLQEVFHVSHPKPEQVAAQVLQLYRDGTAADMAAGGRHSDLLLHVQFIMQTITLGWKPDLSALLLLGSDNRYHLPRQMYQPNRGEGWNLEELVRGPFLHEQYNLTRTSPGRPTLMQDMCSMLPLQQMHPVTFIEQLKASSPRNEPSWYSGVYAFLQHHHANLSDYDKAELRQLPLLLFKESDSPSSRARHDLVYWSPPLSGGNLRGLPEVPCLHPDVITQQTKEILRDVFLVQYPDNEHMVARVLSMYKDGNVQALIARGQHEELLEHVIFLLKLKFFTEQSADLAYLRLRCQDDVYRLPEEVYFPSRGVDWNLQEILQGPFIHDQYLEGKQGVAINRLLKLPSYPKVEGGTLPADFARKLADGTTYLQCLAILRDHHQYYRSLLTPGTVAYKMVSNMLVMSTDGERLHPLKTVYLPSDELMRYFKPQEVPFLKVDMNDTHQWDFLSVFGMHRTANADMLLDLLTKLRGQPGVNLQLVRKVYELLKLAADEATGPRLYQDFCRKALVFVPPGTITDPTHITKGSWKTPGEVFWSGPRMSDPSTLYLKSVYGHLEDLFTRTLHVRDKGLRDVVKHLETLRDDTGTDPEQVVDLYTDISDLLLDPDTQEVDKTWLTSRVATSPLLLVAKGDKMEWVTSETGPLYVIDDPDLGRMYKAYVHTLVIPGNHLPSCRPFLQRLDPMPRYLSLVFHKVIHVGVMQTDNSLTKLVRSWAPLHARILFGDNPKKLKDLAQTGSLIHLMAGSVRTGTSLTCSFHLDGCPDIQQQVNSGRDVVDGQHQFYIDRSVMTSQEVKYSLAVMFASCWGASREAERAMVLVAVAEEEARQILVRWMLVPDASPSQYPLFHDDALAPSSVII